MKRLLNLAASTTIFCSATYAYIYYQTARNQKQHQQILQAGTIKDASRLSNDSFGISWGFQADDIVMSKIDSGDYLFLKFDCSQCLSPNDYIKCTYDSMLRLEQQFDSIGFAYRNYEGLHVVYNQFGETKIRKYQQLVGLPYLQGLVIQKNSKKDIELHKKLKKLLQNGQDGCVRIEPVQESAVLMANRLNSILDGSDAQVITDLRQLIKTSEQILVRTETNRTLRSL